MRLIENIVTREPIHIRVVRAVPTYSAISETATENWAESDMTDIPKIIEMMSVKQNDCP